MAYIGQKFDLALLAFSIFKTFMASSFFSFSYIQHYTLDII
jgi:hypothetical protein